MTADQATPRAIAVLLEEHAEGHGYLDPLDAMRSASTAGGTAMIPPVLEALAYLDGSIEEHIAKEEEALFPLLKAGLPDDDRLIDEMVAEHDYVRIHRDGLREVIEELLTGHDDLDALREELRSAAVDSAPEALETLRRAARKVAETALIHFENEEELVFPLAPQLLTPEELAGAAEHMDPIAERYAAARA